MPEKTCRNCGGITNSAVCDWLPDIEDETSEGLDSFQPRICYVKFDFIEKKWVKGCSYNETPEWRKAYIDGLLGGSR